MEERSGRIIHYNQRDAAALHTRSPTSGWSWAVAAGVFLIQFTVPSFVTSYGVLLVHLVEDKHWFPSRGLLPPLVHAASWYLTDPICRRKLSGWNPNVKLTAISGILLVAGSIAMNTLLQSVMLQIITYGVLGGLGTSLVVMQAELVLCCHFSSQRGVVQAVCHVGMALGQFCMPLLLSGFINVYGVRGALLLQSGIILQALVGAVLLLPSQDFLPERQYVTRPRAYTVINDMELCNMSQSLDNCHTGCSPLLSECHFKSVKTNEITSNQQTTPTRSPILMTRRKNINGVDILPEIPEESEVSSENEDESESESTESEHNKVMSGDCSLHIVTLSPVYHKASSSAHNHKAIDRRQRRFRNNSIKTNYNNHKQSLQKWESINLHTHTNKDTNSVINTESNCEYNIPTKSEEVVVNINKDVDEDSMCSTSSVECNHSINSKLLPSRSFHYQKSSFLMLCRWLCCSCCSWYCRYNFYLTILNIPNSIYIYLLLPLWAAMKYHKFFPALCLQTTVKLSPVVFATLTPSLTRRYVRESSFQEAAFVVSVSGFTWLCFLLMSPCFSEMKQKNYKYIYFLGCLISTSGFYTLSATKSHSYIIMASAFFGLGHGATLSMGPTFFNEDYGVEDFLQGPLDGASGCLILFIALVLGVCLHPADSLTHYFTAMAIIQLATGLMWFVLLLKPFLLKLFCLNDSIGNCPRGDDFLTPG